MAFEITRKTQKQNSHRKSKKRTHMFENGLRNVGLCFKSAVGALRLHTVIDVSCVYIPFKIFVLKWIKW